MMKRLRPLLVATAARTLPLLKQLELRDAFVFGGLGIGCHGLAMLSEPASWMVCGLVLFTLGVRGGRA